MIWPGESGALIARDEYVRFWRKAEIWSKANIDPTGLQVTLLMPTGNPSISGNTPSMLFGLVLLLTA